MPSEIAPANVEMGEAWAGPLFERFLRFRELMAGALAPHGDAAIGTLPPAPGDRVLDIGCGFGDTTRGIAPIVGASGEVIGLDIAEPFLELAREETEAAEIENVHFVRGDGQVTDLDGPFDYLYSRFGLMFFADPVAGFKNLREATAPGGRLCAAIWRRREDNEWVSRAEVVAREVLDQPEESDPNRPGPFAMADADLVSSQLLAAGFQSIGVRRVELPMNIGPDLEAAVQFSLTVGVAGELMRADPRLAEDRRPRLEAGLRDAFADLETPDGVLAPASSWTLTASVA